MSAWHRFATLPAGRRTKWSVVLAWLLLAGLATVFAGRVDEVQTNDVRNWLPASAESTRALDLADAEFASDDPENLLVLYVRDTGVTATDRAHAAADLAALAPLAAASAKPPSGARSDQDAPGPPGPVASADGRALLLVLPLTADQVAEENLPAVLESARAALGAAPDGLEVWITGGPAIMADFEASFDSLDSTLLMVTVAVVAVLLLLTYRSPVLLIIPLVAVGVAHQLANALVYLAGRDLGLVVDGASAGILTVLLFGAGTDYALLLISRYREELYRHTDRHQAMRQALRRSLPAILASAGTVILALLALLFADLNSTRGLGPVAALGIGSALLVMTTLLPALLLICGRRAFWPLIPDAAHAGRAATAGDGLTPTATGGADPAVDQRGGLPAGVWGRVAGFVAAHARPVWIGTAAVLAGLALATTSLSTGLPQTASFVDPPDSVRAAALLAEHYPAGSAAPTDLFTPVGSAAAVRTAAAAVPGVARLDTVEPSTSGQWVRIAVILADDPAGEAAQQTVARLRDAVHAVDAGALVGGETAEQLDQDTTMDRDLALVIPLILLIVAGVLMVLLRAVVAALLLLVSVVLSFGAALGASALIFQALGHPTIDKSLLLNGFLFLVALGVDYTIFLMTRAREETTLHGHRLGVPRALAVTGGVITSAGLVLAATFSVLTLMPLVFMMQLGVLVAVGVLLDTFVVRTLLVPALVLDTGPRSWWPSRLAAAAPSHPERDRPHHLADTMS